MRGEVHANLVDDILQKCNYHASCSAIFAPLKKRKENGEIVHLERSICLFCFFLLKFKLQKLHPKFVWFLAFLLQTDKQLLTNFLLPRNLQNKNISFLQIEMNFQIHCSFNTQHVHILSWKFKMMIKLEKITESFRYYKQ